MPDPLVVVNCKTYSTASGAAAEALAVQMMSLETSARMVLSVSPLDLAPVIAAAPDLEVWTQHLDPVGHGSNTGRIQPETAISRGAAGSLINHAERKVSLGHVDELLAMCVASGINVLIFSQHGATLRLEAQYLDGGSNDVLKVK